MPRYALNLLLVATIAVAAVLLWWSVSDNYHAGPSYYVIAAPLPYEPVIFVPNAEYVTTVQDALNDIPLSMGPQWGFVTQNTRPATLHITIHAISGVQDTDSGWANCLNPEWSGMADYRVGAIYVCVDWWRSDADIRYAILHETIHMMGVGHYFGEGPNMMCSEENNQSTCAGASTDIRLSDDTDTQSVLRYMYGDDGWSAPNRQHTCRIFYTDTMSCTEPLPT